MDPFTSQAKVDIAAQDLIVIDGQVFDICALREWITCEDVHPVTEQPFTQSQVQDIRRVYANSSKTDRSSAVRAFALRREIAQEEKQTEITPPPGMDHTMQEVLDLFSDLIGVQFNADQQKHLQHVMSAFTSQPEKALEMSARLGNLLDGSMDDVSSGKRTPEDVIDDDNWDSLNLDIVTLLDTWDPRAPLPGTQANCDPSVGRSNNDEGDKRSGCDTTDHSNNTPPENSGV